MRSLVVACALSLVAFAGTIRAQEGLEKPESYEDRASYSLGHQVGRNLAQEDFAVNIDLLMQGVRDGLSGADTLLNEQEMMAAMQALQQQMMAGQQRRLAAQGERNQQEGEAFLATNKERGSVVTLPSGLQYEVITEGDGPVPQAEDKVSVHYRGSLIDGSQFDSSYDRGQPASFPVNGVIQGWIEALQLMKVGSKWKLYVPPHLAYGERGRPPVIGPSATLVFEVELLGIEGGEG